ncbi:hypothetical protein [Nocardioides sp. GY 10127]|uniref:hypothetical protein n=1 Tax=Nocardioides sp. GY 10127 TaxID=2569762 RepID=UPI0010A88A2F|nr:hypothetical protein [Nocardioides sp. GY 10127]TIC84097.1 hypothetical protein E8D37_04630 [Nocardioides sp. GY 10127]
MTTLSALGSSASLSSLTATSTARQRPPDPFESVSSLLGTSADELRQRVADGTSLLDIASEKGVSSDDLLQALRDGAPAGLKGSDGLEDAVQQIASATGADAVRGPQGPHGPRGPRPDGPPPGPPPSSDTDDSTSSTLETLAALLEEDSDSLLSQLTSGTSLADLLSAKGVTMDDVTSALQSSWSGATTGLQVDTRA